MHNLDPANTAFGYFQQNPGTMFGAQGEPSFPMAFPFGNGMTGMAMSVGGQMLASQFGIPQSMQYQMFPTMNPADFMERQRWYAEKQRALQAATEADARSQMMMAENIAKMTGMPFGREERAMAQSVVNFVKPFAPMLAQMMPEMYDDAMTLAGGRGSSAVMALGMHRGGRYAIDPLTGSMGLSGESAGVLANTIKDQYFGPRSDINTFHGLSAGRAGLLYEEMATRGLMTRSIGTYESDTQRRLLLETPEGLEAGLTTLKNRDPAKFDKLVSAAEERSGRQVRGRGLSNDQELKEISQLDGVAASLMTELGKFAGSPEMERAMREFDARKIKDKLKDMSGAISAMRDIFGDSGRADAPMAELISGLQKMTQNGLTSMSATELEQSVRMTYQLSKQSGMGLDAMMGVQGQLGQMADRYGIDRGFAIQAGQNMAAFAGAYRAVGAGGTPEFGKSGLDKMAMLDAELNMRAAASPLANSLSAAARLVEEGRVGADSDIARLTKAAKEGKTTYIGADGKEHSINIDQAQWLQMAQNAGVSQNEANTILQQTKANEDYGIRNNMQTAVRNVMGQEVADMYLRPAFEQAASGFAERAGKKLNQSETQTNKLREAIANAVTGTLDDAGMIEPEERKKKMGDAVRGAIRSHLQAQGMAPAAIDNALSQFSDTDINNVVSMMSGEANQVFGANAQELGYDSFADYLVANSPEVRDQRAKQKKKAEERVELQKALGGVGRSSFMARVHEAMEGGKTLQEAIGTILGQVDNKELERALVPVDAALKQLEADPNGLNTTMYKDALMRGGDAAKTALEEYAKSKGVGVDDLNYTDDTLAAGLKAAQTTGAYKRNEYDRIKTWAHATQEFEAQLKELEKQKPSAENDAKRERLIATQAAIADGGAKAKTAFEKRIADNTKLTDADRVKLRAGQIDEVDLPESEKIQLRALYAAQREEHSIDETLARSSELPPTEPEKQPAASAGAESRKRPPKKLPQPPTTPEEAAAAAAIGGKPGEGKQPPADPYTETARTPQKQETAEAPTGAGGTEKPIRITGTVTLNGDGTANVDFTNSQYGSTPVGGGGR